MVAPAQAQDLSLVQPITRILPGDEDVPNNPVLPIVFIKTGVLPGQGADAIIALYVSNRWGGAWQFTVFDYHHYHPNAHEVLVVASGEADIQLGGPSGQIFNVTDGDVIVLPAGTGHCRLRSTPDFQVCGAYPPGQEKYETIRVGSRPASQDQDRIASVALPLSCPVFGDANLLLTAWSV